VVIVAFSYGVVGLGLAGGEATYSIVGVAATVGISMYAAVMLAVVVGTLVPMLCHRAGVDPAIAAGPFVTTLIDISAQIIYLSLATWLLLG
jgi:magnesium transporter